MPLIPAATARRVLLAGAGLFANPERNAAPATVRRIVEQLGFVQVDTINVAERAHDHILRTRLDGYRPAHLRRLIERDRHLFEHWTHDASIIPAKWLHHWGWRFERERARRADRATGWWRTRLGDDPQGVIRAVRNRIRREGPLRARDFETPEGQRGPWWGWKPAKAALEHLWRTGELAIAARDGFEKVYDLMERVHPETDAASDEATYVDWACRTALDRLGTATPTELANYFAAVPIPAARTWAASAVESGDAIPVRIESANDTAPRAGVAHPDYRKRDARAGEPPERLRLLSPFDPVARDRKRLARLFDFDYRFEAFVPEAKREYGYYVLPVLDGERFVGRVDPKLHRDRGVLEVKGVWWEPGVRVTRRLEARLEEALWQWSEPLGAEAVEIAG